MITLVDIGLGNLASVGFALDRLGASWRLSSSARDVGDSSHLILPGVGAFPEGMSRLQERGLDSAVRKHAQAGRPLLGICLGMQLLADVGEEHGSTKGLSLLPGRVVALDANVGERVPNIGWCEVTARQGGRLMADVPGHETFYFVHGYHFVCADPRHVSATLRFGGKDIVAAVEDGNIFGVQFHPEKSQDAGIELIERFLRF